MSEQVRNNPPEKVLELLTELRADAEQRQERTRRTRRRTRRLVLAGVIAVALLLLAVNVFIWGGFSHIRLVGALAA